MYISHDFCIAMWRITCTWNGGKGGMYMYTVRKLSPVFITSMCTWPVVTSHDLIDKLETDNGKIPRFLISGVTYGIIMGLGFSYAYMEVYERPVSLFSSLNQKNRVITIFANIRKTIAFREYTRNLHVIVHNVWTTGNYIALGSNLI